VEWRHWLGGARAGVDEARWVMVDVETSGLDADRDRLLAIAAVALRVDWAGKRLAITPGDSFEVVLRQQEVSGPENILLHGIGAQRQREGVPAQKALEEFRAYAGRSPLLAFHAAFDRALITRYMSAELGAVPPQPWLDIEKLCAVTHEQVPARSLDEWMTHFGIRCAVRHQAAADAMAECEVLLRVWPRVAAECGSWRDVERLAERQRWIARA
jgi:DNA polymerase III subunit epsilon